MAIGTPSLGTIASNTDITLEVSAPPVVTNGDSLQMWVTVTDDVSSSVDEAGWDQIEQVFGSAGLDHSLALYRKIASAESGTYTVNIKGGVSAAMVAQIVAWPGVDASTPEDATPTTVVDQQNSLSFSPPDITTVTPGAVVQTIIYVRGAGLGLPDGTPAGYTTAGVLNQTNAYQGLVYNTIATATAESPGDWLSFSTSAGGSLITWAMRPAGAGGTITSQLQGSNLGADLFDGTII
jgi:hypothetical protein